ncbi:PAS domain S-box protein [Actinoplanes sp. NEAU-A11]|uniref:Sensor-like histidine kinase SenX3 n=2 Tax=Actinoplanes aureus TaxID=2792083 RepID=A0A931C6K0_9ACTN|nr:PAS domain S-box protein [Actinoplanes aureus]
MDTAARRWTDGEITALVDSADLVRPAVAGPAELAVATLDTASLLDSVQEAFLAVNPDAIVVGFNRAAHDMLGYAPGEVCGRRLDDTVLPDYAGRPIRAALDRLFTHRPVRPVLREISVRHRDGHRVRVRVALSVVRGAAGPLACLFLNDLSEQTAIRELAERHDGFLTALLDSLNVGVIACDEAGRVVVVNRVLRELQGLPATAPLPEDYPASIDGVLHDPAMRPIPWEKIPLMRALRGEHLDDIDILTARPGDQVRVFASAAQPIRAGDGRPLGAVAVAQDVTAMRRAERFRACHRDVQEVLRTARSVAGAAPTVLRAVATALGWPYAELYLIDEPTGQLRSVGHWDAEGAQEDPLFGHTPVRGHGVTGRVWQSGQAMWVADVTASPELRHPYEQRREQAFMRRGIRTVLSVPIHDGATLVGVLTCYAAAPEVHEDLLTVLLDGVAAQIGVFVALRRAQELARQLARAQDDFITLVGHELRTPLTSIAANATLLDEDPTGLTGEDRQMVHAIARNTEALQMTIDSLLELAGLESGHLDMRVRQVDLTAIVGGAVTAAHRSTAGTGVRVHADLPPRLVVDGDPARLRQVVDGVLINALKYSPSGGDVRIRLQQAGNTAELCVIDSGIGTPEQERERVFDRFFRGSNVRHHGTSGSGLGLSLARAIVRLHHGTIHLSANDPSGTIACIRLPLRQETAPA